MKMAILNLDEDIEQLKVTASFFGGVIATNVTSRKVGWKAFVLKTGKRKKLVREFYLDHPKLCNK